MIALLKYTHSKLQCFSSAAKCTLRCTATMHFSRAAPFQCSEVHTSVHWQDTLLPKRIALLLKCLVLLSQHIALLSKHIAVQYALHHEVHLICIAVHMQCSALQCTLLHLHIYDLLNWMLIVLPNWLEVHCRALQGTASTPHPHCSVQCNEYCICTAMQQYICSVCTA